MFNKDLTKAVVILVWNIFIRSLTLAVVATDTEVTARLVDLISAFPVHITVSIPLMRIGFGSRKRS